MIKNSVFILKKLKENTEVFKKKDTMSFLFFFNLGFSCFTIYLVSVLSHVRLFVALWTVVWQAPLFMGFLRQEYWGVGSHFLLQGIFPTQGSNLHLLRLLFVSTERWVEFPMLYSRFLLESIFYKVVYLCVYENLFFTQ